MPEGSPQPQAEIENPSLGIMESERHRYREVVQAAETLFQLETDWLTFFREILGSGGVMRRNLQSHEEIILFERSPEFAHIQGLLAQLRLKSEPDPKAEPTKMITVRLPQSVHQSLVDEADRRATSMNKLCIAKLLQVIDEQMAPRPTPKKEDVEATAEN